MAVKNYPAGRSGIVVSSRYGDDDEYRVGFKVVGKEGDIHVVLPSVYVGMDHVMETDCGGSFSISKSDARELADFLCEITEEDE